MTFLHFIKLVLKNILWLILIPAVMAATIFYFTRNEKKVYSSESVIYTGIASGYSLNGSTKADFYATSNAFDNLLSLINSRETKQDVCVHLLATHLMAGRPDPDIISTNIFNQLKKIIPDSVRKQVAKSSLPETVIAVSDYMNKSEDNVIYTLINSNDPFYSLNAMENVKALRINNSDLIKLSYQTNDALACKQTLELLEESFMKKHRRIKEGQSESVVAYFENETKNAFGRLNGAEDRFMEFNKQNDIINYYEQTKAVAGERENLYAQNHNLEMDEMANSKSLEKVNDNIKSRLFQSEYGAAIVKEREQLSDLYNRIAVGEIVNGKDPAHIHELDSLRSEAGDMEKKLSKSVNSLYVHSNTPNGIPGKSVLDEWLKTTLAFEQSKARLTVMDKRKKEFVEEYRKFAPLGATLKKIERQINVNEREYLELLHGLNMARLAQQNNELTTKLNIVDAPYMPVKANASKRMVAVIVGFLVGFILVLVVILARALVNKTLQQPERAARVIGIPLLGIYPLLNMNESFIEKANLRLVQQLLSRINTKLKPVTIGFISIQHKEGKTTIVDILYKALTGLNYKVKKYEWHKDLLIPEEKGIDIVLLEMPALDTMMIKPGMLPNMEHSFLLARANRVWTRIDKDMLRIFSATTGNEPLLLLNGVDTDFAEEFIGEVPRKRNRVREVFKRLAKFEFGNRKKIK